MHSCTQSEIVIKKAFYSYNNVKNILFRGNIYKAIYIDIFMWRGGKNGDRQIVKSNMFVHILKPCNPSLPLHFWSKHPITYQGLGTFDCFLKRLIWCSRKEIKRKYVSFLHHSHVNIYETYIPLFVSFLCTMCNNYKRLISCLRSLLYSCEISFVQKIKNI